MKRFIAENQKIR